jgi:hypothetical protein
MRNTHATLNARVAMVSRALGMPDGERAGGLHLVRQNGGVSVMVRHADGQNGGELLHHGTAAETVAFLQGLIMADAVRTMARRRVLLPGETA